MNRAFKLFAACVGSLRTAEKEYEMNPTKFNRNIVSNMQNKVDGWLVWINGKEEIETTNTVPPFVGKGRNSGSQNISNDIIKKLMENHTAEEIEEFKKQIGLTERQQQ